MFTFTTDSTIDLCAFLKSIIDVNWVKYPIVCTYNTKHLSNVIDIGQVVSHDDVKYFKEEESHILLFKTEGICFAFVDGKHEFGFTVRAAMPGDVGIGIRIAESPLILNYITVDMTLDGFNDLYERCQVITPDDVLNE